MRLIMEQAVAALLAPAMFARRLSRRPGARWAGLSLRAARPYWLRIDESGRIVRIRVCRRPSVNWHGFHVAAENFAFQDFPIILATLDLSVAENDR